MEIFKDIPGYEGMYQVSNQGRVKSLKLNKERILKLVDNRGYLQVMLYNEGKFKAIKVHQLVAMAFLNHTPNGYNGLIVDHQDNNKLNNNLSNLQLVTNRYNASKDKKGGTSKYTGVSWNKERNKWISEIKINGKRKYLGRFKCELAAAVAYQKELIKLNKL